MHGLPNLKKVVKLLVLCTSHLYPPGNNLGTHFCWRLSQPQGYSVAGRIMSTKIPLTPLGTEPVTFWLVAQCLNQLRYHAKYV